MTVTGPTGRRHRRLVVPIAAGVVVLGAIVARLVYVHLTATPSQRLVDLDVYRNAGTSVLHGRDLYAFLSHAPQHLPFTYPPFAALLATPLAWLSFGAAGVVWTVGILATTALLCAVGFARLLPRAGRWWPLALGAVAGCAQLMLPLRDEIKFGQVDELLALLVVADVVLMRGRRGHGVLVGLAAAVKLTPGIFIVYLLVRRRWVAAATAAGTFIAATLLAAAVLPGDSRQFWTHTVFHTERLRSNAGTSNQSLRGMWLRALPGHEHLVTLAWLVSASVVAVIGLRRAVTASRRGDEVAAVAIVGLLGVLVSPVSWIHHLAWLPLVLGVLLDDGRNRWRWLATAGVYAFFVVRVPWLGSHAAASGTAVPLGRIVQDGFGLMALVLLMAMRPRTPDYAECGIATSVAPAVTVSHTEGVHPGGDP